jgi:hypothetical protein
MPGPALGEPGHREPTAPNHSVFGKGIHGVLTTAGYEPTARRPQRRHHVPVQLDHINQRTGHRGAYPGDEPARSRGAPPRSSHRSVPATSKARRRPLRSCCSNHADDTCRLLGSARITTWSSGCRPANIGRATCRSRRATRWRSTADPTRLAMIKPTRGPSSSWHGIPRRTWTMTSGCTVRIPYFTVASNSVDRLMRLRAESTARKPDLRSGS